jgi:hypothetical protein
MKGVVIILSALIFCSSNIHGQVRDFKDIIGRWEIIGKDMNGANLEVIDSSRIFLTYQGEKRQVVSPVLNITKSPAWFDFDIIDSTGKIHVKTLVQVYSNGVMKWQLFLDEERPDYFTLSGGELLYLKKVKTEPDPIVKAQD